MGIRGLGHIGIAISVMAALSVPFCAQTQTVPVSSLVPKAH